MANLLAAHRVIGIRHVIRKLKLAGLADSSSHYADEAVSDVQDEMELRAAEWYMIGAKRGALEVLRCIQEGKIQVVKSGDGFKLIPRISAIRWRRQLKVIVGNKKRLVPPKGYRLLIDDLFYAGHGSRQPRGKETLRARARA